MWQNRLKEIIYILENSNVNEIEVSFWGRKYRVVKKPNTISDIPVQKSKSITLGTEKENNIESNTENDKNKEIKGEQLLSPMPGTFYIAPTPDDPPFVSKGDKVKKGQTLCIIEAMKIMNEIESEYDGHIVDVLVKNSEPVEYNQALFIIEPTE